MKYTKVDDGYVLRLLKGEKVIESLVEFAAKEDLQAGFVTGIGALTDVALGYYNQETKSYDKNTFTSRYELLSLLGNISYLDGKPMPHIHAVLGGIDFGTIGGHLIEGTVTVTAEIHISTSKTRLGRAMDDEFKLNLLDI